MRKYIPAICLTVLIHFSVFGQDNLDQLFQKADSNYFDYKNFGIALNFYEQIEKKLTPKDKDYSYVIDKIAKSMFYLESTFRDSSNNEKSIEYSQKFIDFVDKNKIYIDTAIYVKKYFMCKNIIVAYFSLGQKNKARPYQDKLYSYYKSKELPEGIDQFYNFEFFKWKELNIWGYEWYPNLGDPETEKSFAKQIYYIYSTDQNGKDKDELYTLQTIKIHKRENTPPYYVLTKRKYLEKGEKSETIWAYTFDNPVDYDKLHDAIVEYLKGNVNSDTESEIEYGKGGKVKIK